MKTQPAEARGSRPHPDVYVGGALLAVCAVVLWNTTTFPEVPAMLSQNVPPTFFPRLVVAVMALLSALLVVRGARRTREPGEKIAPAVLVTAAVITLFVALMPRLGTLTTVGVAAVVLPLCWGERRVRRILLLGIALPLSVYSIFVLALGMRLPTGLLP